MDHEETKKQLQETIELLESFFWKRCINSDLILENTGDQGWYYMHQETAKKLKRQVIKYKMR